MWCLAHVLQAGRRVQVLDEVLQRCMMAGHRDPHLQGTHAVRPEVCEDAALLLVPCRL
jgi:hypothetical protein